MSRIEGHCDLRPLSQHICKSLCSHPDSIPVEPVRPQAHHTSHPGSAELQPFVKGIRNLLFRHFSQLLLFLIAEAAAVHPFIIFFSIVHNIVSKHKKSLSDIIEHGKYAHTRKHGKVLLQGDRRPRKHPCSCRLCSSVCCKITDRYVDRKAQSALHGAAAVPEGVSSVEHIAQNAADDIVCRR